VSTGASLTGHRANAFVVIRAAALVGILLPLSTVCGQSPIEAVDSIGVTVADLDRELSFYTSVLSFEKVSQSEQAGDATEHLVGLFAAHSMTARLRLGEESIELTKFLTPEGRPIPAESRSNDRWFQHIAIVVSDMNKAYALLRAHNVRHASSAPQTLPAWNPSAGGISAFYFKDPEGHTLELIHFPSGKGDPRWQRPTDRLFLGIDHTAIVVSDTDASLAFYRDTLGMRVAGTSENFGTEQEHLNAVFGARLRITALRAERGPGVELLEYLAPAGGRPYPADATAADLVTWTTNLTHPDPRAFEARLRSVRTTWISPGLVPLSGSAGAAMIRDPDGHALRFGPPVQTGQ
jgi:catechol 2,3-dioxygenase-like lactoylglutathione lyase family enzyme